MFDCSPGGIQVRTKDLRTEKPSAKVIDSGHPVDPILDGGIDLPDVTGDFHITINGVPLCQVDRAFVGSETSPCEFSSLNNSLAVRAKLTATFPAAIVTVTPGKCSSHSARRVA